MSNISLVLTAATLLLVIIMFLLLFLFYSRVQKIILNKQVLRYKDLIKTCISQVIFDGKSFHQLMQCEHFKRNWQSAYFRKKMLETIIQTQHNISGEILENLKQFYIESDLVSISRQKMASDEWFKKYRGIRELSRMGIKDSINHFAPQLNAKHKPLQLEAFLGIIRLKGVDALKILQNHETPINEWIQVNIIHELKKEGSTKAPDFSFLLKKESDSLKILGLRLIGLYKQKENIDLLLHCYQSCKNEKVRNMAALVYESICENSILIKRDIEIEQLKRHNKSSSNDNEQNVFITNYYSMIAIGFILAFVLMFGNIETLSGNKLKLFTAPIQLYSFFHQSFSETPIKDKADTHYFVVLGSFKERENALHLANKLLEHHHEINIVYKSENQHFLVINGDFPTKDDAMKKLISTRTNLEKEAWIWTAY